ncbi:uncharacterized protein LOC115080438 [Rhinatrema bivittatum]|uniref:uncharacterized protein LOC115080438 n=1 Tax=Rhinatrema bivittatum TaxID=194408 RepID=UPI001126F79C|nr:uncharacterized protein LOC115080438 [Rhinatrema bivittatum]XP_029440459.1 uncharacterized protein LOC115080438 [Rhinatrema bivittatum]XP_029440460.1 uncharacterized protein LOC115080438 [Rhinatrema bivittatum]
MLLWMLMIAGILFAHSATSDASDSNASLEENMAPLLEGIADEIKLEAQVIFLKGVQMFNEFFKSPKHDTNRTVYLETCDCDYHCGGCSISRVAPPNKACHCKYKGLWTCGGEVTDCKQPDAPYCKNPDRTLASCLEGGGDCGAYPDSCDCEYHVEGCRVSVAASPYTACRCYIFFFWSCAGTLVQCKDGNAGSCSNPDTSKASCLEGGGNCGGY